MGTYAYKCTTEKLTEAFRHIETSGHQVLDWVHTGGRDWVVIARSDGSYDNGGEWPQAGGRRG